jgi:hypothetical protein
MDSEDRVVTVQIEKHHRTPQDDFDIIDYDWKGVYPQDEEEVLEREYEKTEELNIREYAASLGVDIDNINMSLVDKTMFSSGLNLTRSTMDQLTRAGYVQEVTQQSDGMEYTTDEEGESVPFRRFGGTVNEDEIREAETISRPKIPFLDTDSPWSKAVPVKDLEEMEPSEAASFGRQNSDIMSLPTSVDDGDTDATAGPTDPIDLLTVKRLKEILREQGLRVSGSKAELKERLRNHVNSMLKERPEQAEKT